MYQAKAELSEESPYFHGVDDLTNPLSRMNLGFRKNRKKPQPHQDSSKKQLNSTKEMRFSSLSKQKDDICQSASKLSAQKQSQTSSGNK